MNSQPRRPNGRFDRKVHGPSDVELDNQNEGVARDVLAASLERFGLDETLTGLDGRTITQAWDEKFAILDEPEQPRTEQVVYDALGDINIGRHRGGPWLVWFDPNLDTMDEEDYDGNPTGQWEDVTADNVDDPRGRVLAAQFHTRNGGGNRECWCDSDARDAPDHQDCTGQVVGELQNRPDHLYDADGAYDYTYADFYFQLPADAEDALVKSVRSEEHTRAQGAAKLLLDRIEAGENGPWDVFDVNPETETALHDCLLRRREPFPEKPRGLDPRALQVTPSPEDVAYIDALLAAASAAEAPPAATKQWHNNSVFAQFDRTAAAERAAYQETQDLRNVLADHRAGRLPAAVVRTLGGADEMERAFASAGNRLVQLQGKLAGHRHAVEELHAYLRDHVAVQERRAAAVVESDRIEWALRWPGPVDTCPSASG